MPTEHFSGHEKRLLINPIVLDIAKEMCLKGLEGPVGETLVVVCVKETFLTEF